MVGVELNHLSWLWLVHNQFHPSLFGAGAQKLEPRGAYLFSYYHQNKDENFERSKLPLLQVRNLRFLAASSTLHSQCSYSTPARLKHHVHCFKIDVVLTAYQNPSEPNSQNTYIGMRGECASEYCGKHSKRKTGEASIPPRSSGWCSFVCEVAGDLMIFLAAPSSEGEFQLSEAMPPGCVLLCHLSL